MTATTDPAGTPIPAGVLKVADDPNLNVYALCMSDSGRVLTWVTSDERARLLAGPPRPDGVPDDHEVALIVNRSLARTLAQCDSDNRTLAALGVEARRALEAVGVPVPPYRPDPDTITVNRDDLRLVADALRESDTPVALAAIDALIRVHGLLGQPWAAAGLPPEPTEGGES